MDETEHSIKIHQNRINKKNDISTKKYRNKLNVHH